MNEAGKAGCPFLFGVDYEQEEGFFYRMPIVQQEVLWQIGAVTNAAYPVVSPNRDFSFSRKPLTYEAYEQKFGVIRQGLLRGDSFLANLTVRTEVATDLSLADIFRYSRARYRLWVPDRFVCFSPETFVRIQEGRISSYPMKGTIDALIPDAERVILEDYKETSEHYTIVDLIRNDLSMVATDVRVERFRYIDRLETTNGAILQVSSEIAGRLPKDYPAYLGDILFRMLPAGSISGAPKEATVKMIGKAEKEKRGFYTGVFGYFDGRDLDSAVLIRFIEYREGKCYFRSGGGITVNSRCEDEYREVLQKVYLPF